MNWFGRAGAALAGKNNEKDFSGRGCLIDFD
jgi:hypothetical protein